MGKRLAVVFLGMVVAFNLLIVRIYTLSTGDTLAQAAEIQSKYTLTLGESRGYIYDRNMVPMVNTTTAYKAVVEPTPEAIEALSQFMDREEQILLIDKLEAMKPIILDVKDNNIYAKGVTVYPVLQRYSTQILAPHIIGHLTDNNKGVMGVELAYNDYLLSHSGKLEVTYTTNAGGGMLMGAGQEQINSNYNDTHGVVLTIDSDLQRIVEEAMNDISKGAAVVMEVNTGEIVAAASIPDFQPYDVSASLAQEENPFYNRIYSPYVVGSTFKLLVAAEALEQGFSTNTTYKCEGEIEVGGTIYGCHYKEGHGEINMETAIRISCNPYFVQLAQDVGAQSIAYKAAQIGFGEAVELMPGIYTGQGVLPSYEQLRNIGEAANFSFGQGLLTATPIQIAQMISTIANGGVAVTPKLIEGFTNDGETIWEYTENSLPIQVMDESVSSKIKMMMIDVVENGSGALAKPYTGGAGGKTASAQTGIYEDGQEIVHGWFAGFYPSYQPQYAIVIIVEEGNSGGDVAAPVFKEICDRMRFIVH